MARETLETVALEKGIDIRTLARKAKVSEVTMWRYINRKKVPSIPIAAVIADTLGIDWQEVIKLCEEEKDADVK
jgi:transcriptional regulator with XRE-family HTH domain